jgi:integrase
VLAYAVDVGYIARNPCRDLSRNQRPRQGDGRRRILTREEEARLLAYCGSRPWLRPVIVVALNQALRLGEAAGLQRADVDFANNKLRVHRQLSREGTLQLTKGASRNRRDRRDTHPIDLMPASREALLELFTDDLAETGFVFRNRRGSYRRPADIAKAFRSVVEKAGLPETEDGKVTFHALRHTGISRLANHPRVPLVYVRDFAGHASLSTTETYVHKIESAETTAAAALAMAGTSLAHESGNGED